MALIFRIKVFPLSFLSNIIRFLLFSSSRHHLHISARSHPIGPSHAAERKERKISPEVRKMSPRIPLRIDPAAAAPAPAVLTLANASAPPPSSCTHFTSMKSPILNPIFHRIGANPLLTGSQTLGQFREMLSSASSQAESGSDIEFYPRHPLDRPGAAGPVAFLDGPSGEGQRGGEGVTDGAEVVGNHGNDENEQGESSNTTPPPPPPSTPTQQEQPKTPSPLQNTAASFERSDLQQLHRLVPELERSTITWNPRRRDPEQRRGTTGTWNPNSPDLSLSPSPPQQQQEEEPTNQRPTPEQPAPLRRTRARATTTTHSRVPSATASTPKTPTTPSRRNNNHNHNRNPSTPLSAHPHTPTRATGPRIPLPPPSPPSPNNHTPLFRPYRNPPNHPLFPNPLFPHYPTTTTTPLPPFPNYPPPPPPTPTTRPAAPSPLPPLPQNPQPQPQGGVGKGGGGGNIRRATLRSESRPQIGRSRPHTLEEVPGRFRSVQSCWYCSEGRVGMRCPVCGRVV